jgi:ribosomal protein L34E
MGVSRMKETIVVYKCDTCGQVITDFARISPVETSIYYIGIREPLRTPLKDFCSVRCLKESLIKELDLIQEDFNEPYEGGK